jgi:hypothetical protein
VQVIAVARTANLIFIVLDVLKPLGHKKILERELEGFGIRLARTSLSPSTNRLHSVLYIAVICNFFADSILFLALNIVPDPFLPLGSVSQRYGSGSFYH